MRTITVDEGAIAILDAGKKLCKEIGIEKPTYSESVRILERNLIERLKVVEQALEERKNKSDDRHERRAIDFELHKKQLIREHINRGG